MNYHRVLFCYCLLPLLAGTLIYLLFRNDSWLHDRLFDQDTRLPLLGMEGMIADIVKYQLPDFCWSFSLTAALVVWKNWWGRPIPFFLLYIILIVAGSELIQLSVFNGFTFDIRDLFAAVLAAVLSFFLIIKYEIH